MSDFDLTLINEYKNVPAFYNRKCQAYKDKVFIERAWNIIGQKLSSNAKLLKTRMDQLRNRYNLERRRLKLMREKGILNAKTSWNLFHNLNFLSGHIRQRRSYRKMKLIDRRNNGFRGFTEENVKSALNRSHLFDRNIDENILNESDDMEDYDKNNDIVDSTTNLNNDLKVIKLQPHNNLIKQSEILKSIHVLKQSLLEDVCSSSGEQNERNRHPLNKFEAFGSFLNISLQHLPKEKALLIINRLTSEVVHGLSESTDDSSNVCDPTKFL